MATSGSEIRQRAAACGPDEAPYIPQPAVDAETDPPELVVDKASDKVRAVELDVQKDTSRLGMGAVDGRG
jgi:hypothetical protein